LGPKFEVRCVGDYQIQTGTFSFPKMVQASTDWNLAE